MIWFPFGITKKVAVVILLGSGMGYGIIDSIVSGRVTIKEKLKGYKTVTLLNEKSLDSYWSKKLKEFKDDSERVNVVLDSSSNELDDLKKWCKEASEMVYYEYEKLFEMVYKWCTHSTDNRLYIEGKLGLEILDDDISEESWRIKTNAYKNSSNEEWDKVKRTDSLEVSTLKESCEAYLTEEWKEESNDIQHLSRWCTKPTSEDRDKFSTLNSAQHALQKLQ